MQMSSKWIGHFRFEQTREFGYKPSGSFQTFDQLLDLPHLHIPISAWFHVLRSHFLSLASSLKSKIILYINSICRSMKERTAWHDDVQKRTPNGVLKIEFTRGPSRQNSTLHGPCDMFFKIWEFWPHRQLHKATT